MGCCYLDRKHRSAQGAWYLGVIMEQWTEKRTRRVDANLTEFGAHLEPALHVEPGETFLVETQDNFFGEIKTLSENRHSW